ncbi:hypothetical protein JJQ72_06185 [Paenibacillus sp. F411]|uniref:hypothetical protein n=1 Tax=Paenibacillus sp. F411 TaxID=2820239 RepID=UPI001AAF9317|nr:hypothetical protein [Paenibacillus sp. F411]MBO2943565.1 hypothetical protein [Paenibacillus sp. F411]
MDKVARALALSAKMGSVSIEDFGGIGDYNFSTKTGHNNDDAFRRAAEFLNENKNYKLIITEGYFKISQDIELPSLVTVEGIGVYELFGSATTGSDAQNFPTIAPYLKGSVIVQTGEGKNGIKVQGVAPVVNLRDFGILFDRNFQNTGHGITVESPAITGGYDDGLFSSDWSNIKVFGHDGNHYAFNMVNALYNTFTNLRSYGGGVLRHLGEGVVNSGNAVFTNLYGSVFVGGSAHGISLENPNNATNKINLMTFIRPQVWIDGRRTLPSGVTPPTSSQRNLSAGLGSLTDIGFVSPDFETSVGSKAFYPYGTGCYFTPGKTLIGNDISTNIQNGVIYQNKTGSGLFFNMAIKLDPTADTDATAIVTVGSSSTLSSGNVMPARLIVPKGGPIGQIMMLSFPVWSGAYFKVDLANSTVSWTTKISSIL